MKITIALWALFVSLSFAESNIAVKTVKSDFLSKTEGESVTNFITSTLSETVTNEKVMAWSDLEEMLKQIGETSQLAQLADDASASECVNDKCFEELGGALGVEKILITDISKVGSSFLINMRVLNLLEASSKARGSLRVKNGIDGILDGIPTILAKVGYSKDQATPVEPKKEEISNKDAKDEAVKSTVASLDVSPKEEPNSTVAKTTLRVIGGALFAVGGAWAYVANEKVEQAYEDVDESMLNADKVLYDEAVKESEDGDLGRKLGLGLMGAGLLSFTISFSF